LGCDALHFISACARSAHAAQPCMASNGLSAVRSRVAGVREHTVRSTAAAEAVAELGSLDA